MILVQVCRRWRHLIFESPRRLDLQLVCTLSTSTRRLLKFWPHLPIIVYSRRNLSHVGTEDVDNLMTALKRRNRTSQIFISGVHHYALPKLIAKMNKPFPILTKVSLENVELTRYRMPPVLPATFLGGSAPSLRSLSLTNVDFPTFPTFILSSTHIVHLSLIDVGEFSPEAIASCLAALPKLNFFHIGSQYDPRPHTIQQSVSPLTRAVLPALTHFSFRGVGEYFEDLVARIDTPILERLSISFVISALEIPRIHDFIDRIEHLGPFGRADIDVFDGVMRMTLGSPISTQFRLALECRLQDWIIMPSMTQIFSQQLRLLSHVEQVEIRGPRWRIIAPVQVIDSSAWLGLFHLFVSVKSLYVSKVLVSTVAAVLKELTPERAMEVFPVLGNLYLEGLQSSGSVLESMGPFVASRQLSGHPVVIENWEQQLSLNDEMDDD